ncbi:hypothetical protein N7E81_04775 [Reichenbachiella carrageenanivorans]|uniref:Peptidoglycan binding domain-containing protein n=1 Tax=Reichenbachiella carrageenanivorans TaxID=2979869 RepID=A0ABY6D2L9_9BACT|nr:hypothetical protein [Reichenbachiella carrageenanivorans]UXX80412.1 hypothetical protein N7E81_04775 [Reichenbachiella carrageenanivorans]
MSSINVKKVQAWFTLKGYVVGDNGVWSEPEQTALDQYQQTLVDGKRLPSKYKDGKIDVEGTSHKQQFPPFSRQNDSIWGEKRNFRDRMTEKTKKIDLVVKLIET